MITTKTAAPVIFVRMAAAAVKKKIAMVQENTEHWVAKHWAVIMTIFGAVFAYSNLSKEVEFNAREIDSLKERIVDREVIMGRLEDLKNDQKRLKDAQEKLGQKIDKLISLREKAKTSAVVIQRPLAVDQESPRQLAVRNLMRDLLE